MIIINNNNNNDNSHTNSLDDRGVRHEVRRHLRRPHLLQQLASLVHEAAARQGVEHRVVGDAIGPDPALLHLLVELGDPVVLPRHREALEDGGVDHVVHQGPLLLVLPGGLHELPSVARVVVRDQRVHHAAQRHGRGPHLPLGHLGPELPDARHLARLPVGLSLDFECMLLYVNILYV